MAENRYRISLRDVDPAKYADDWADIVEWRSWGERQVILDAAASGSPSKYENARLTTLVKAWSLPGDPSNESDVKNAGEYVIGYLLQRMDAFYNAQREEFDARVKASGTS